FEKGFRVVMILTARPATEGHAAGCVGRGDAGEDGEGRRRARPVRIGLVLDQRGHLHELLGAPELGLCLGAATDLGTTSVSRARAHRRLRKTLDGSSPTRTIPSAATFSTTGGRSRRRRGSSRSES